MKIFFPYVLRFFCFCVFIKKITTKTMDKKFINWRVIMQSLLGKSTGVDDEQVEEWLHEDARNQE